MAIKPILFSGPMVRAILKGRKTQTRRVLLEQPESYETSPGVERLVYPFAIEGEPRLRVATGNGSTGVITTQVIPYAPGDLLYVREAHALLPRLAYRGSIGVGTIDQREHPTDGYSAAVFREGFDRSGPPPWRPSIHMPRWASRLTLRVTEVRIQKLQDISEADAWAEGCKRGDPTDNGGWFPAEEPHPKGGTVGWDCARDWFADLWDGLNSARGFGWDENPWVFAYSFEVIQKNVDEVAAAAQTGESNA